jgi:hypothetical protein
VSNGTRYPPPPAFFIAAASPQPTGSIPYGRDSKIRTRVRLYVDSEAYSIFFADCHVLYPMLIAVGSAT